MIMATLAARHPNNGRRWQQEMAQAITRPEELLDALGLDRSLAAGALQAAERFRMRVPWSYVRRMRRGDPADPLLRQVLPLSQECEEVEGFVSDPLGEQLALRAPGLLHKYQGRALLITTSACAVHCRYCFRREFPYSQQTSEGERWSEAIEAIASDPSIEEVILSGGDPLSLSDARLGSLTQALARIRHIRRLRVHTRQPIVLPSRVDAGLLDWLSTLRWPTVFVLHANHPNEIDEDVKHACARLREAGITLLNQSVLLRGVNDDVDTLARLSSLLFEAGVLPYYLHLLDRVRGVTHFEVPESRAREIASGLLARLPGYLAPRLVREVAGEPSKVPVTLRVTV